MKRIRILSAPVIDSLMMLAACSTRSAPRTDPEPIAPDQISDFATLYTQNCAACHGAEGRGGASIALANPVYLAIVDEPTMRKVVANGIRGTSMPAFAQSAGGMLTDEQISAIASGIFSHWQRKGSRRHKSRPVYGKTANVDRGQLTFGTYCASCHGPQGGGTQKGSAITNDSFLALVSDQALRTIVIWQAGTGRTRLARRSARTCNDRSGDHRRSYWLSRGECRIRGSLMPLQTTRNGLRRNTRRNNMSTNTALTTSAADASLSRRGFLMKLGILFNGFAAIVVALPVAGFIFSSLTRSRGNGYLSWVPLGDVSNFPEGETRMATFRNPLVMPTDGKTVDTACWVRLYRRQSISSVRHQLRPSRVSRPLVRAIWTFHVSLPRRRVLPRWLACVRTA